MITFRPWGIKMGKHFILLHGALGSKNQLAGLENPLSDYGKIHSFNFTGHGGGSISSKMLMPHLTDQLSTFIKEVIPAGASLTVFGYSMGGYAALLLASQQICRMDQVITLGTKLKWNAEIAARETAMLDPRIISEKIPAFAAELERRHHPADWKQLLGKTADMMTDLGTQQYLRKETFERIQVLCKLMIGDKDKMVTLDETRDAVSQIKNASLSVLPSTPHPIEKVSLERLVFELNN